MKKRLSVKTIAFLILISVVLTGGFNLSVFADSSGYSLVYNTVKDSNGNWVTGGIEYDNRFSSFNCYAFAIGRLDDTIIYQSGYRYQVGVISKSGIFTAETTLPELVEMIEMDLIAMGYSNISSSYTLPSVSSSERLICVRLGSGASVAADYHFMRYDIETDAWYHKPGSHAIMKYNYVPTSDRAWYPEYYDIGGAAYDESMPTYTGDIVYIKYSKNIINPTGQNIVIGPVHATSDWFYEITIPVGGNYRLSLESSRLFKFDLYNQEFVNNSAFSDGTLAYDEIINLETGVYYLRISGAEYPFFDDVSVSLGHNQHNWIYRSISGSQHKAMCACGSNHNETHFVRSSQIVNNRYATCYRCYDDLDLSVDNANITLAKIKITKNGSYILSNGIVVLEDADLDAYLNNSLHFYDTDNVPELN